MLDSERQEKDEEKNCSARPPTIAVSLAYLFIQCFFNNNFHFNRAFGPDMAWVRFVRAKDTTQTSKYRVHSARAAEAIRSFLLSPFFFSRLSLSLSVSLSVDKYTQRKDNGRSVSMSVRREWEEKLNDCDLNCVLWFSS